MINYILQATLKSFLSLLQHMLSIPLLKLKAPFTGDEDGFFSNKPVCSSFVHKYKYDVATSTEKAPGLSYDKNVDLLKNVFMSEENVFSETIRPFKY